MGKGGSGSSGEQKEGWGPPVPPSCTLAVGKRGSAYWMSPWIWICMVVRERWNTVRACRREWGTVTDPPQPQAAPRGVPTCPVPAGRGCSGSGHSTGNNEPPLQREQEHQQERPGAQGAVGGAQRQRGASTPGWVRGSCLSSPPPHSQLSPALISSSVWFMMNLFGATQKSLVPCGDRGTSSVPTALGTAPASPSLPSCPTHHRSRRVNGHGGPAEDKHEEPTAQHPAGRAGSTGGEHGRGSP